MQRLFLICLLALPCHGVELVESSLRSGARNIALSASFNLKFSDPLNPKTLKGIRLLAKSGRQKPIRTKKSTDLTNASITDYPIGTKPEPNFAPELMFPIWQWGGTSPNGIIEYLPDQDPPLKHQLLYCFYSACDIAAMSLGKDGLPTRVRKLRSPSDKLAFNGPLDITQDPRTGSLYVADFGRQSVFGQDSSLIWLRPAKAM